MRSHRAKAPIVTAERLRELLVYDPDTGAFVDRETGAAVGRVHKRTGYVTISIDGRDYLAHRLAWLYMRGKWPPRHIDHRDLCPSNNVFTNLRLATRGQNAANSRAYRNNKLGVKGVSQLPSGRFRAQITHRRKCRKIGTFDTIAAASAAYAAAARRAFGEFART